MDETRARTVNDYTFRAYRDLYFIQQRWFSVRRRYFQGKPTMRAVPDYRTNSKVDPGFGLTDLVDTWRDIGYVDEYAPVLLRVDYYGGPQGEGYIVTAQVKINGRVWQNQMHQGPEDRGENYVWVRMPEPSL